MHRPAPRATSTCTSAGRSASARARRAAPAAEAGAGAEDEDAARAALDELERLAGDRSAGGPRARRCRRSRDGALAATRTGASARGSASPSILAGPATNLIFAVVLFTALFFVGGGKATTTVDQVLPSRPAAAVGLQPGDQIARDQRHARRRRRHPAADLRLQGQADHAAGRCATVASSALGPVRPQKIDGAYRLGFVLRGEKLGVGASAWQSVKLTGIVTKEIGKSLARPRPRQGPQGHLEPGRDRPDARTTRSEAGRARPTSGCSG